MFQLISSTEKYGIYNPSIFVCIHLSICVCFFMAQQIVNTSACRVIYTVHSSFQIMITSTAISAKTKVTTIANICAPLTSVDCHQLTQPRYKRLPLSVQFAPGSGEGSVVLFNKSSNQYFHRVYEYFCIEIRDSGSAKVFVLSAFFR